MIHRTTHARSLRSGLTVRFTNPHHSIPASHAVASASLGIRQSPRGDRLTVPTFGPSGTQLRLNWFWKNRRTKRAERPFDHLRRILPAELRPRGEV